MKTRSKAKKIEEFDLAKWLSSMPLSEEEFVKEFQKIALRGDYDSVCKLLPFLDQDEYFSDGGVRARRILDSGNDDIFVLLARLPAYRRINPQQTKVQNLLFLAVFLCIAIVFYFTAIRE